MQWATVPYATGRSTIHMLAAEAQDASGGVQYYFQNVTIANGSHDSGWQDNRTYTDVGLDPNTVYEYRLKARGFMRVETGYSVQLPAKTHAMLTDTPEGSAEPVSGELGNDLSLQVETVGTTDTPCQAYRILSTSTATDSWIASCIARRRIPHPTVHQTP